MIPKIVHQIWLGSKPKQDITTCVESVQKNFAEYSYKFWNEESLLKADLDLYTINDLDIRQILNSALPIVGKVDLLRFVVLAKYGGIYVDADFEFFKPLPLKFLDCDVLLSAEPFGICTGLLGLKSNSEVSKGMINQISAEISTKKIDQTNIVQTIGPAAFQRVLQELSIYENYNTKILPPHMLGLIPHQSTFIMKKFIRNNHFENGFPSELIAIHHYNAGWMSHLKQFFAQFTQTIKGLILRKALLNSGLNENRKYES